MGMFEWVWCWPPTDATWMSFCDQCIERNNDGSGSLIVLYFGKNGCHEKAFGPCLHVFAFVCVCVSESVCVQSSCVISTTPNRRKMVYNNRHLLHNSGHWHKLNGLVEPVSKTTSFENVSIDGLLFLFHTLVFIELSHCVHLKIQSSVQEVSRLWVYSSRLDDAVSLLLHGGAYDPNSISWLHL